uniref:Globin domain-containing protein n=1 Tax=Strombidium inclinatum TaxID=197538 RepID=A0A7S3MSQ3_9SPIT|mmetsp:Transcript_11550/g.17422  ORF Transcript_11550/g.17422 Transcript_11550/m.17422 type:complete len:153 (+) Transcript_11550:17-475(+)|eukprot:CAMPEP_0170491398 /NCGR_PEP_ID=MMETSP0208-20121228/10938_1 /TAXON_ID=197538 /ORGANISM="Strombidium inclinatum, Strain S3" /LENGTH=152 /DNA_ID=CAMNT_0010766965 /DNA_START=11 /DNA_END=469 /DNA_ORIENTATION=-
MDGTSLTNDQVTKLQAFMDKVGALDPTYNTQGFLCFEKIFAIAPEALQLYPFKDDSGDEYKSKLSKHASGLFRTLHKGIKGWGTKENDEFFTQLGSRHVGYSVIVPHFEIVGMAIVETLQDLMKAKFSPELQDVWKTYYTIIVDKMQKGNYY